MALPGRVWTLLQVDQDPAEGGSTRMAEAQQDGAGCRGEGGL